MTFDQWWQQSRFARELPNSYSLCKEVWDAKQITGATTVDIDHGQINLVTLSFHHPDLARDFAQQVQSQLPREPQ